MQFSTLSLLVALTSLVSAQNPFNFLTTPVVKVGTPFNITWSPSTGTTDTITLLLRQGNPNALTNVETIACTSPIPFLSPLLLPKVPNPSLPASIQNTGSYLWTPGPELVNGPLYAFEIVDDGNKYITNYSQQFAISSPNTISSSFAAASTSLSPSQSSELKSSSTATTTGVSSTSTGTGALLSTATGTKSATGASTTGSKTTGAASSVPSNAGTGMKASGGLLMFVGAAMAML